MSRRVLWCLSVAGVCAWPALASAQLVASDQEVEQRPGYRQAMKAFPPPGGRYGGGALEYVLTGGRPEPIAPRYEGVAAPQIGYITPVPPYIHPVPAARYRTRHVYAPRSYAPQPVYSQPAYAQPVYAPPSATPPFLGALFAPTAITQQQPDEYAVSPQRAVLPAGGLPDYNPQAGDFAGGQPAVQPISYAPAGSYDPVAADPGLVTRPMNPAYYRQEVAYSGRERVGTVVIDTPEKFLYLVQPGGRALRYGIGVGRPGFSWSGVKRISRKAQWPGWTPPREMMARRPDLPRHMDGGEANPLGARALYLGSSLYRIHGTNEPYTIGTNVSSGCIRMMNADVEDLYERVAVGTTVIVR